MPKSSAKPAASLRAADNVTRHAGHKRICEVPCRDLELANQKLILLQEVMAGINSGADVMEVLHLVVESYVKIAGTPMCSLRLLQRDGTSLATVVSAGFPEEYREMEKACHTDAGPCGLAATSLAMVEVADIETDPRFSEQRPFAREGGYRSVLAIPLVSRLGQLLGTMVSYYARPHHCTSEEKQIARLFGMQAAIAIENAYLYEKLRQLSVTDDLTGTYNYRYFRENLELEMARSKRWKRSLSLIMIDIDDFKKYNDFFGHQQGDLVLRAVARTFREGVRVSDVVARYGGEEFAVILPETDREGGLAIAEKLRQAVERQDFSHARVTISTGVASYPSDGQSPKTLVAAADAALYAAKRLGKNRSYGPEDVSQKPCIPSNKVV